MEENLGRVPDWLDRTGMAEDTVIFHTSDNGSFPGEHGWYGKRFTCESSPRIPLLVRYPRLGPAGAVIDALAANIDSAPTIPDFAGVPVPASMQGRSLRPLLEGRAPEDWRRPVYYASFENTWQLRNARPEQLRIQTSATSLEADPHELNNLSGQPAFAEVEAKLKQELRRSQERHGDV